MSLIKKIKDYYKHNLYNKNVLFTTPSHAQGSVIPPAAKELFGEKFYKCDFSEIEGFDNLRNPEGILKDILDKFSEIYRSKKSFLLTNGSTSGMIAMMMATLKEGDKVLIARNCHISVYNALVITGAVPIWFMPEFDSNWGVYKGITSNLIEKYITSDIKAVVITSPTYEGLFSDISGIAAVCRKYNAKLLVDEAHGALLNFGDFKTKPAILNGADMSVQSLHKTAGAPNPCSLLHISSESSVDSQKVQDCLNIINTTSPSYPLMLACEICVDYLNSQTGRRSVETLLKVIDEYKTTISDNIKFYNDDFNDPTKILLKFNNASGLDVADILNEKFNIEEEFSNPASMLFITGIGTTPEKIKRLFDCLNRVPKEIEPAIVKNDIDYNIPKMIMTPRQAVNKEHEITDVPLSIGRVIAEPLMDYPPGIPFILPGEVVDEKVIKYIKKDKIKVCV